MSRPSTHCTCFFLVDAAHCPHSRSPSGSLHPPRPARPSFSLFLSSPIPNPRFLLLHLPIVSHCDRLSPFFSRPPFFFFLSFFRSFASSHSLDPFHLQRPSSGYPVTPSGKPFHSFGSTPRSLPTEPQRLTPTTEHSTTSPILALGSGRHSFSGP